MPHVSATLTLPVAVDTFPAVCKAFAREENLRLEASGEGRLVYKEPLSLKSALRNPVTLKVTYANAGPTTTRVVLDLDMFGWGPIQRKILERRRDALVHRLQQQAAVPSAPVATEAQPAPVTKEAARPERAALVPEQFVDTNHVFISYRRADSADVAGRLYDRLTRHFGAETVFKDVDSIPLGVDFRVHLSEVIAQCRVVLVLIGNQWMDARDAAGKRRLDQSGDFVRVEVEAALQRDIPVIPVYVKGAPEPDAAALPQTMQPLAYRNGLPLRSDPDFHRDVDRLVEALQAYLTAR